MFFLDEHDLGRKSARMRLQELASARMRVQKLEIMVTHLGSRPSFDSV